MQIPFKKMKSGLHFTKKGNEKRVEEFLRAYETLRDNCVRGMCGEIHKLSHIGVHSYQLKNYLLFYFKLNSVRTKYSKLHLLGLDYLTVCSFRCQTDA